MNINSPQLSRSASSESLLSLPPSPPPTPSSAHAPNSLHLQPATFQDYLDLNLHDDPHHRYDLIDGILFCKTHMRGTTTHENICSLLLYLFIRLASHSNLSINVFLEPTVQIRDESGRTGDTTREPDIGIKRVPRRSSNSDSPERKVRFPLTGDPPALVVEVTSPTTRVEDMEAKWTEYARTNIKYYVIIDRVEPTSSAGSSSSHQRLGRARKISQPCVVIGYLDGDGTPAETGYPVPEEERNTSTTGSASGTSASGRLRSQRLYKQRVLFGNDIIDCPFFAGLRLTVNDVLNPQRVEELCKQEKLEVDQKMATETRKRRKAETGEQKQRERAERRKARLKALGFSSSSSSGSS